MMPCAWNAEFAGVWMASGMPSDSSNVILIGDPVGFVHVPLRYTDGPFAASYSYTGRRMSWRRYQSVLSSDVFATITSLRMPSTSCAYHNGNVSLSPTVTRMPYGSTLLSRSRAKSVVSVWLAREACCQLPNNGTKAMASSGDARRKLRG